MIKVCNYSDDLIKRRSVRTKEWKFKKEENLGMICCGEAGREIYCVLLARNGVEIITKWSLLLAGCFCYDSVDLLLSPTRFVGDVPHRNGDKMCRLSVRKILLNSNNWLLFLLPEILRCSCTVELLTHP
jgi:hypothetical protein